MLVPFDTCADAASASYTRCLPGIEWLLCDAQQAARLAHLARIVVENLPEGKPNFGGICS